MFHSLALAIQSSSTPPSNPRLTLDAIDKSVKVVAVILGGIWTYLNYIRGRTFKRRLEPRISGEVCMVSSTSTPMISGSVQAKNVGLSKVDI
jgi:hypothetical protein